jgi:hypothetical protein
VIRLKARNMEKFEFELKNEKLLFYHRFIYFLIGLNLAVFAWFSLNANTEFVRMTSLFGAGVAFASYVFNFLFIKRGSSRLLYFGGAGIIGAWLVLGYWWIAALVLLLFIAYSFARRRLIVHFFATGINYPSVPRRTVNWDALNNVILKDGLLTIDFKSNKILQGEIVIFGDQEQVEEQIFNNFCRDHLLRKVDSTP